MKLYIFKAQSNRSHVQFLLFTYAETTVSENHPQMVTSPFLILNQLWLSHSLFLCEIKYKKITVSISSWHFHSRSGKGKTSWCQLVLPWVKERAPSLEWQFGYSACGLGTSNRDCVFCLLMAPCSIILDKQGKHCINKILVGLCKPVKMKTFTAHTVKVCTGSNHV